MMIIQCDIVYDVKLPYPGKISYPGFLPECLHIFIPGLIYPGKFPYPGKSPSLVIFSYNYQSFYTKG